MAHRRHPAHRCENCDRIWTDRDILPPKRINRYFERVAPGEIAPSGECPTCGALTHLTEPVGIVHELILAAKAARERLLTAIDANDPEEESEKRTLKLDQRAEARLSRALRNFS